MHLLRNATTLTIIDNVLCIICIAPGDYAPQMMILLTIPNGETSVTHSIMIVNDMMDEGPEIFTVTLSDPADNGFPITLGIESTIVTILGKELCSISQFSVFIIKY